MSVKIHVGDCREVLRRLAAQSVHCVVTSPPYWGLRDYNTEPVLWGGDGECGHVWGSEKIITNTAPRDHNGAYDWSDTRGTENKRKALSASTGQLCQRCGCWRGNLGLEPTPLLYVEHVVEVFREVWRVLRDDGTLWLNLGDSYAANGARQTGRNDGGRPEKDRGWAEYDIVRTRIDCDHGLKPKDLIGIPWRVALALQADGWYLRSAMPWVKKSAMPESVRDRPTTAHEYVFMLVKGQRKSRVVKLANLPSEFVHFSYDAGFQSPNSGAVAIGIRIASTILNVAQSKHNISLTPFDPEIRKQCKDDFDRFFISDSPVVHRAATLSARFLDSRISAKEFFQKLNSLGIALSDTNDLLICGRLPLVSLSPGISIDGNTAIAINYAGKICKFDFVHNTIITQSSSGCKYYYDREAVKVGCKPESEKRYQSAFHVGEKETSGQGRPGSVANTPGMKQYIGTRNRRTSDTFYESLDIRIEDQRAYLAHLEHIRGSGGMLLSENGDPAALLVNTHGYAGAHFATFPPKLIEPMIKAGTSERGCCRDCGAGWVRVVEKPASDWEERKQAGAIGGTLTKGHNTTHGNGTNHTLGRRKSTTLGWQPSCSCNTGSPIPCTILDPFVGSGTTLLVADRLGRDAIGIDLSGDYAEMARQRVQGDAPMFVDVEVIR